MSTKKRLLRSRFKTILDEANVFCGDPNLVDKLVDTAVEIFTTRRKKPQEQDSNNINYYKVARALARVCVLDYEGNKGWLFKEAKLIMKMTPKPTVELLEQIYGEDGIWYKEHYFGKQGQEPSPLMIRRSWAQLSGVAKKSKVIVI